MDVKVEIKEESCFLEFSSKDHAEKVKSEPVTSGSDIKTEIEEVVVSNLHLLNQREYLSGDPSVRFNNSSKGIDIKIKTEIKEECCSVETTSTETLCIYDDFKDAADENSCSIKSPSLHERDSTSCTSYLFSNEDLRNHVTFNMSGNSNECERARKCQSQESSVTDVSSLKMTVCSETPNDVKILSMPSCLKQNNFLQQSDINEQDINEKNSKYKKADKCHKLVHEGKNVHKCNVCDKVFNQSWCLKRHKLIHDGLKPYKCNICDKKFADLSNLKAHNLIHEGKRTHKCDICEKAFIHVTSLKKHKLIHEGKKLYNCDICGKGFLFSSYVKTHKLIHEGIRRFKCDFCDKTFTHLQHVKIHTLIHQGIKPYKCNICDKAFTQSSHLKTHKLIHDGKKSYKCDVCNKAFTQLSKLTAHKPIHESETAN